MNYNPSAFGYSWWYKAIPLILAEDVATPLHPGAIEQRNEEFQLFLQGCGSFRFWQGRVRQQAFGS